MQHSFRLWQRGEGDWTAEGEPIIYWVEHRFSEVHICKLAISWTLFSLHDNMLAMNTPLRWIFENIWLIKCRILMLPWRRRDFCNFVKYTLRSSHESRSHTFQRKLWFLWGNNGTETKVFICLVRVQKFTAVVFVGSFYSLGFFNTLGFFYTLAYVVCADIAVIPFPLHPYNSLFIMTFCIVCIFNQQNTY